VANKKDFWESVDEGGFFLHSAMDTHLAGKSLGGEEMESVLSLSDRGRAEKAIPTPQNAGTRVAFKANLGSVLTYPNVPEDGLGGTVITVKTASGNMTHLDNYHFVLWDDGEFRAIQGEHLRNAKTTEKRANNFRRVVADLGDLSGMFLQAGAAGEGELVHKATQDLWSFRQDGGQFVIERLFDGDGSPLKV